MKPDDISQNVWATVERMSVVGEKNPIMQKMQLFAAQVAMAAVEAEREACAQLADKRKQDCRSDAKDHKGVEGTLTYSDGWDFACDEAEIIAAAIRQRGANGSA